jgi:hypothetical protein
VFFYALLSPTSKLAQQGIKKPTLACGLLIVVGKTGFEPATLWSQTRCATGLRYFPKSDPSWTRTNDLLLRRQLLYPAELWGQWGRKGKDYVWFLIHIWFSLLKIVCGFHKGTSNYKDSK